MEPLSAQGAAGAISATMLSLLLIGTGLGNISGSCFDLDILHAALTGYTVATSGAHAVPT
jgi:hypothetical protein